MWSFYLFIAFYLTSTNASITLRCAPDTIQSHYDNKVCYLFVNESKSFVDAESFCNHRGGNLAIVSSQFVNSFIWSTAFETFGTFNNYWVGGKMKTVKMNAASAINVWAWTKNNELGHFPIGTQHRLQQGIALVSSSTADFSYCDDGWDYLNLTNSCYRKFSTVKIIQPKAENLCIQKGGHLVSIHSAEENQFIGDVYSVGFVTSAYASVFWIGAQRNDNSNNWYWTDNTTFDFAIWGHLWDFSNKHCAHFWPDWTSQSNSPLDWNADGCSAILYGYVCKKSPNVVPID